MSMSVLNYLLEFDVESDVPDLDILEELDITDKTMLENQINESRRSYKKLIILYDNLQNDKIKAQSRLSSRKQSFYAKFSNRTERINEIAMDESILELQSTIDALVDAMQTVRNYMDFVKNDLRFLSNSMYNKF